MKKIILAITLLSSISAFADCTVSFNKPHSGAMSASYITDSTYNQILEILSTKGYTVLTTEELKINKPEFKLKVMGYYGYGCGTGLTFIDYLTLPAYNSIEFSGLEGLKISIEKSFSSPVGVRKIAKHHLLKSIKNLPNCAGSES